MGSPTILFFNPDTEMAVANSSPYYMPPKAIAAMSKDLSYLPLWMLEGDMIISDVALTPEFEALCKLFNRDVTVLPLSEICQWDAEKRSNYELKAWGYNPRDCERFSGFKNVETWKTEYKHLYSREKTILIQQYLKEIYKSSNVIGFDNEPRVFHAIEDLNNAISDGDYVVKAPWSSSGRGVLCVSEKLTDKERQWLSGVVQHQGFLMLEKRLNKISDFAMEFILEQGKCRFLGYSQSFIGKNFEYCGNYVGMQQSILEPILSNGISIDVVNTFIQSMCAAIESVFGKDYSGPIGIDMLLYSSGNDVLICPCIECNLRWNMGLLALNISKNYVTDTFHGAFRILGFKHDDEALNFIKLKEEENPAIFVNGKLDKGFLNLCPVWPQISFVAWVESYQ